MKPIIINKGAEITDGLLTGISGRVVGADASYNEVMIEIECGTIVTISRDKVYQFSAPVYTEIQMDLGGEDTQP